MTVRAIDSRIRPVAALAAMLLAVFAMSAHAADLDDLSWLRGTVGSDGAVMSWRGVNLGASVGVSNLNADFGHATQSLVAYSLRNTLLEQEFAPENWTTLPKTTTNSMQYGAFLGYNMQWDSLVLGLDLGYNHLNSMQAGTSDTIARQVTTSDTAVHDVTINSSASLRLIDYATFRARAGYVFGQFLPYAIIGGAVGRFNYTASATVTDLWTLNGVTTNYAPGTQTDTKNNAFAAGFVTGLGLDVALLPNVFLRAEWEYTIFAPVSGIRTQLNTGRVGVGVRF
jgi:outer membrane immunogenic protein